MGVINKILFRNNKAVQFVSIGTFPDGIPEKAILSFQDKRIDVSDKHWVLCQVPFVVGIYFSNFDGGPNECTLSILVGYTTCSSISLIKTGKPDFAVDHFVLYNVADVSCYQLGAFHRGLLLTYFYLKRRNKLSFKKAQQFCALYAYPRKVSIISFKDDLGYNLFPMDFQGCMPEQHIHVLGLRHSNITLPRILKNKKLVVSEVNASDIQHAYYLGEHHSSQPPSIHQLPFSVFESSLHKFYLPDFITSYSELEIIDYLNLGSHMLLVGKVLNQQSLKKEKNDLLHLHFIQFLERQKVKA